MESLKNHYNFHEQTRFSGTINWSTGTDNPTTAASIVLFCRSSPLLLPSSPVTFADRCVNNISRKIKHISSQFTRIQHLPCSYLSVHTILAFFASIQMRTARVSPIPPWTTYNINILYIVHNIYYNMVFRRIPMRLAPYSSTPTPIDLVSSHFSSIVYMLRGIFITRINKYVHYVQNLDLPSCF